MRDPGSRNTGVYIIIKFQKILYWNSGCWKDNYSKMLLKSKKNTLILFIIATIVLIMMIIKRLPSIFMSQTLSNNKKKHQMIPPIGEILLDAKINMNIYNVYDNFISIYYSCICMTSHIFVSRPSFIFESIYK